MSDLIHSLGWQLIFLPAAAAVVSVMAWRGMLGQRVLDRGPTRDMELSPLQAGVGAVLGPLSIPLLGMPAVMALVYCCASVEAGFRRVGLVPRWPKRDLGVALLAVPIAVIIASALIVLFYLIGQLIGYPAPLNAEAGHQTLVTLKNSNDPWHIISIVLMAAIVIPIIEEISFRGVMQTALLNLVGTDRRWAALGLTALVFGLAHAPVLTSWHGIPALIGLGLVFGYVYERTGSLLCCTLVHAGFNAWNLGIVMLGRFV